MNPLLCRHNAVRVALLLVLVVVAVPVAQSGFWPAETIAASNTWDYYYNSLAFSPLTDEPAIAYWTGGRQPAIKFVERRGGVWGSPIVIDTKGEGDVGLAFDPQTGYPTIAYGGPNLKVARWTGTRWVITVVDASEAPNLQLSMAFDTTGNLSISYRSKFGKGRNSALILKHAWFDGTWHTETVDWASAVDKQALDVGPWSALAFDAYHRPTIAYVTGWYPTNSLAYPFCRLKFATKGQAGWNIEEVNADYGAGGYVNLAYGAAGVPVIIDRAGADGSTAALRFIKRDGTETSPWSFRTIPVDGSTVAAFPHLKFDAAGRPLVMYQHGGNYHEVIIAHLAPDGTWVSDDVVLPGADRVNTYDSTSFAFDKQGVPAIAFRYHPWDGSDPYDFYFKLARPPL